MSTTQDEHSGEMKSTWLGWAWMLPQLLLAGLNWHAWELVRGDLTPDQHSRAIGIGCFELILLVSGCVAWGIQRMRGKPIGIGLALAAVAVHTGYLWFFLQSLPRLLPTTVSLWMLPETELIFYQFSLIMPVIFLMLVRLARIKVGLSAPVDVGVSLACLVLIPAGVFIFGSLIAQLSRRLTWHDQYQYILIAAMVAATAFILVVFLRLMRRLHDLIERRTWSEWALPLAAGLVAPLAGLALNASIPFPYDFQTPAVYLMTVLNGAMLLIPSRPGTPWALRGWIARAVFYPFTLYFFLVFLPFLPLSLLAMIAAGSGFLILAPVFLFTLHTRRLLEQGRALALAYGSRRILATFAACVLVLPGALMVRHELDRRTLTRAVNAVFSPDYSATRVAMNPTALRRALDRMDDMKHGLYLPYVSDLYDALVFQGMVLPDEKADVIRKSLLGQARPLEPKSRFWGNDFFGGRTRRPRQTRGAGVTRQVVMASHDTRVTSSNDMTQAELRLVLENRGPGNGEFSERISIPEGVLVTGFWLDVNGTNKTAELRERKAATWVYEMIRDMTRRDPGLVVYEDDRHLRLRVFPFAAGEKRTCGLRFQFPSALQPSLKLAESILPLNAPASGSPHAPAAIVTPLTGGGSALVVPAPVAASLPSFRREVVAHLILDQSVGSTSNRAALLSRARSALSSLPDSITRVRVTWANYEQVDAPGGVLSRSAALAVLDHDPGLPARGGFCPELAMARLLSAESTRPPTAEPAGSASLFVVIPASDSSPIRSETLAAFTRLAPDLPAYALLNSQGVTRVPFQGAVTTPTTLSAFTPDPVLAFRYGDRTTYAASDREALLVASSHAPSAWQVWDPVNRQFKALESLLACDDPAYRAGLALWARHRALALTPVAMDAALPDLIKSTREAGVLIPEAAYIVLETRSQEVMLARKERQSLGAPHALEFDNAKTEKAPAPPAVWLILPALWFLWRFKRRGVFTP